MKSDTEVVTMADIKQAAVKMGLSQWHRRGGGQGGRGYGDRGCGIGGRGGGERG